MKKYLILLLLTSISIFTNAQVQYLGNSNNHVVNRGAFIADSMMKLPVRDTIFPTWYAATYKKGSLILKKSDTSLYYFNGTKWNPVVSAGGGGSTDTTSLSNRINLKYTNNSASLLAKGADNSSATASVIFQNSLSSNIFRAWNNGGVHFGSTNSYSSANLAQFDMTATLSQVQFKNASNQSVMYLRQDGVSVWGTNNAAIKLSSTGTNSDVTGQYFVIGAPQNNATTDNGSTGGGIMLYGRGGTATSGSQSGTVILNETFNPSSGNRTFTGLNIFNSYGQSGTATGDLAGIRYAYSGSVTGNNYGILITPTACKNGFGTAGPNSTVEINGGFALVPTIYTTSNPSIGNESISYFMTGCSGTITLPAVQNRILHLVNTSGNTLTLSSAVTNTDLTTTTSLPHTKSIVVQYLGSTYGYRIISSN